MRRAQPQSGWRRRWASPSARRSATACAARQGVRRDPHRGRDRRGPDADAALRPGARLGSGRSSSTSSTSARSTPTSAWRWHGRRAPRFGPICGSSSCRRRSTRSPWRRCSTMRRSSRPRGAPSRSKPSGSTARCRAGRRFDVAVAGLVATRSEREGWHPRVPARRRRYPQGRGTAGRNRRMRRPAALRCAAASRPARRDRSRGGRAQDRSRDQHRRDVADDRGRARGRRRRHDAAAAVRPRLGHGAARDRTRQPCRGRPASRPGGPRCAEGPATGSGPAGRRARLLRIRRPKSRSPTSPGWPSTLPSGVTAMARAWPS